MKRDDTIAVNKQCGKIINEIKELFVLWRKTDQYSNLGDFLNTVVDGVILDSVREMGEQKLCSKIESEEVILYCTERKHKTPTHPKTTHHIKCWSVSFQAMKSGLKTFEYRKNDRNYQVGDILRQEEWNEITSEYTGDTLNQKVTYLLIGGQFGIPENYCIMSVVPA
jgi:hypothetical protein